MTSPAWSLPLLTRTSADFHACYEEYEYGACDGEEKGESGRMVCVCFGQDVGGADVEQEAGEEPEIDKQLPITEVEQQRRGGASDRGRCIKQQQPQAASPCSGHRRNHAR